MSHEKRKRWLPTDAELEQVEKLASIGITEEMIADYLGVSVSTFQAAWKKNRSGLRQRISKGRARAGAVVANKAFQMASSGENTTMTIFWLKTRLRWKETSSLEIEDKTKPKPKESEQEKQKRLDAKLAQLKLMLQE